MKIIVTGGAGFIGSHLCDELSKENEVIAYDDLSAGKRENLAQGKAKLVKADILDEAALAKEMKNTDVVFHEAALVSVPLSLQNPELCMKINVQGTANVLKAAADAGVKKVILAGSAAVYGNEISGKAKEDMAGGFKSPYAISKFQMEEWARKYSEDAGMQTIVLRYFNVYGARQDASSQYSGVISKFIHSFKTGTTPVIYGDGKQTRDFVFVSDVVDANILARSAKKSGTYNIASGKSVTLLDVIGALNRITGKNLQPKFEKARDGDIRNSAADIALARKELGFGPKVFLEEGLKRCF